ncbi:hypothetical protein Cni_G04332 [Canna indica]|uniref:Oberon PHD finger domain-containing protein n=1 Tax=Canna indica TaxID=4628 RepID=A0AAQ3Q250_9LILI|nr:hypothetical protein Cni_G04332 [Canna indica]
MEVDSSNGNNSHTSSLNEKLLVAIPTVANSSGLGLPYAPEDWPSPGDKWRWKVGRRKLPSGYWHDRYLYAPPSCPKPDGSKQALTSKAAIKEYIRKGFPHMDVDVDAFLSSFIWKIPCALDTPPKDTASNIHNYTNSRCSSTIGHTVSESTIGSKSCRAGNKMCIVQSKKRNNHLLAKDCDVCCSETGFCRDCCCILCCQSVHWENEGYSIVRCEATLDENYVCGHVAHLECALRSYMAGTVGGTIGLDAEYYCRRCDSKTDLVSHVVKILILCQSLDTQLDIEKNLSLSFRILHGSQQARAKDLRNHIGLALDEFKRGVPFGEIWKLEDNITTISGCVPHTGKDITLLGTEDITRKDNSIDCTNEVEHLQKNESADRRDSIGFCITSDHNKASEKLKAKINGVLQELKRSQNLEYMIAEEKLYAKKDFLLSLYRQLDYERSDLADPARLPNGGECDALLSNVLHRVDQIKQEEEKLDKLMKISKGFGRTPKSILKEYFGLVIDG